MYLLFTFSDNTKMTSDFITDGAKITECYYNELKYADDSATVKVPFNETLCDKLKSEISKNIKVQIMESTTSPLFTGYARKTMEFSKTQRNQPFSLEILTPNILINVDYKGTAIHYVNKTVAQIVASLLSLTSYSGTIDSSTMNNESCNIFSLSDGDNIASVLQELLYEYGYTYNFNSNGSLIIQSVFNVAPNSITQHFNGDNCLTEITQTVKEDAFKQVSVNWNKVAQRTNVLIFEDTTGADEKNPANITIDANSYYLGEQTNYCEYDSKYQGIVWITDASADITYADASSISQSFENLGTQGSLSIRNNSQSANSITKLQILGTGYFEISANESKVGESGTCKDVSAKYIQADAYANLLARKLADYYNYANFSISVSSKTKYDLGSFCDVSDNGIGTIKCRIIKRIWNIKTNTYSYTLESISEYTPAEIYTSKSITNSKSDNGESLRDAVSSLQDEVDNLNVHTTMCTADVLSQVIKVDENKKTVSTSEFSTKISLKRDDEDLPFSLGTINVPDGWSYTFSDGILTFKVGAGVKIESGRFTIPVQYRVVVGQDYYVDENGEQYVDDTGEPYIEQIFSSSYTQWNLYFQYFSNNGGAYLGGISSVDSIPTNCDYDDYFTWTGTDKTESTLVNTGVLLQGRVYHYIGNVQTWNWEQDTNVGHMQTALSDVLSVANADLKTNNSTVWEYLDHLTTNSIYTDMIVANNVFVSNLMAKMVNAGVITTGTLNDATLQAKLNAEKESIEKLGLSADIESGSVVITGGTILADYISVETLKVENAKHADSADSASDTSKVQGYTLIEGGKITTTLINTDAIKAASGFFDNITVNGFYTSNSTPFQPMGALNIGWNNDALQFSYNKNISNVTREEEGVYIVYFTNPVKLKTHVWNSQNYIDVFAVGNAHDSFNDGFNSQLTISTNWVRNAVNGLLTVDSSGYATVTYVKLYFALDGSLYDPLSAQIFMFGTETA